MLEGVAPPCPATYDPCQEAADLDGDGVHDDCDACPADGSIAATRGGGALPDGDADGLPDACDCEPGAFTPPADVDRDRVRDGCDSCDGWWDPWQEDGDGDGVGDACDRCPLHADLGIDSEPIPGSAPPRFGDGVPDACDACPLALDPGQENCNADAEVAAGLLEPGVAFGGVGVGDACDPIPCGETALVTRATLDPGGSSVRGAIDLLRVDGVRVTEPPEPRYAAWTGLRFCRCAGAGGDTLDDRDRCKAMQPDGVTGGCLVPDLTSYRDRLAEPRSWRHVSARFDPPRAGGPAPPLREDPPRTEVLAGHQPPGARATDALARWDQEADLSRWSATFDETIPFGPGLPLPGVLWTHAAGDPATPVFGDEVARLSSHYWSGPVGAPFEARRPWPCHAWVGPFLGSASGCPACAGAFPAAFLGLPGRPAPGGCAPAGEPPALGLELGALEAAPAFARDPLALLASGARWVAAAEPEGWLPPAGPRYAALDEAGEALVRVLELGPDGLLGEPAQPCPQCDPLPAPLAAASRGAAAAPAVLVLSARRGLAWVVRGAGAPLTVVALDRPGRAGSAGPRGLVLGRVLAATYAPAIDALLVLDEVAAPGGGAARRRVVRLSRLDPWGREGAVLGSFPRGGWSDRFAMGTDPSGALWLAASGERGGAHVVARLSLLGGAPRVLGWGRGPGAIVPGQLRAGRAGVSLVVSGPGGVEAPLGHRVESLAPGRPGDAGRCF